MKSPQPKWETRRAKILHQACLFVANALNNGLHLNPAVKKAIRRFKSRSLGKGRKICLSRSTMYRAWYAWKYRQDLSAFKLHYKSNRKIRIDANLLQTMFHTALDSGLTISEVYIRFGGSKTLRFSLNTLYRILPRRLAELARMKKRFEGIKILVAQDGERLTNKKEMGHAARKHAGISKKQRMRILVSARKSRGNNSVFPVTDQKKQQESCNVNSEKKAGNGKFELKHNQPGGELSFCQGTGE